MAVSNKKSIHTNIKKERLLFKAGIASRPHLMKCDYRGDGIGTKNKSLKFMNDEKFIAVWDDLAKTIHGFTAGLLPDVRWRAHMALWAAKNGLLRDGDFVECGVHAGMLSGLICRYFGFEKLDRKFWLFDTWSGIPTDTIPDAEKKVADKYNKDYHAKDIFEDVQKAFADYPNCRFVRGELPDTLNQSELSSIAYLSMDLNNATFEKACIEKLWPKLTSGAIVLLDDYNFVNCRLQQDMWDEFAAEHDTMVASLPTGQGILIKP